MVHTGNSRLPLVLLGAYLALWLVLAAAPHDRSDWLLENLLVAIAVPLAVLVYRHKPFSLVSCLCLTLFFTLHAVGAHYTYSEVPLGDTLARLFGLSRNHFDRVVHFSFGLLIGIPVFELQSRLWARRGWWNFVLPITATLSFSALYEVMEWIVAILVSPETGTAFLGTQGDVWDAQKDTALALLGACLGMLAVWIADRRGHSLMPAPRRA